MNWHECSTCGVNFEQHDSTTAIPDHLFTRTVTPKAEAAHRSLDARSLRRAFDELAYEQDDGEWVAKRSAHDIAAFAARLLDLLGEREAAHREPDSDLQQAVIDAIAEVGNVINDRTGEPVDSAIIAARVADYVGEAAHRDSPTTYRFGEDLLCEHECHTDPDLDPAACDGCTGTSENERAALATQPAPALISDSPTESYQRDEQIAAIAAALSDIGMFVSQNSWTPRTIAAALYDAGLRKP